MMIDKIPFTQMLLSVSLALQLSFKLSSPTGQSVWIFDQDLVLPVHISTQSLHC